MPSAELSSARRAWRITLAIAIGLLIVGLAQIFVRLHDDLNNRIRERQSVARAQAQLLASQTARLLESMDLLALLTIKGLISRPQDDVFEDLEDNANHHDLIHYLPESALLIMLDDKAQTVMSADALGVSYPPPLSPALFSRHANQGIAFLITRQSGIDRQEYLVVSRSLIDQTGLFRGVVAIALNDIALEPIFRSFSETQSKSIGVIDEEGKIMLYWPQNQEQPRKLTDLPEFKEFALERILYTGALDFSANDTIVAISQVPAFFLRVAVALDSKSSLTIWKRRVRQTIGISVVACCLVGWGLLSLYALEKHRQALEAGLHDKTTELAKTNCELEQALDDVIRLSRTDSLTQLWNRGYLDERLGEEIARAQRLETQVSLMLFDIDRFKSVNDTYGHPTGDEVLRVSASVLRRIARRTDFLSRYGGEEFVVLMPGTGIEAAHALADRLRAELSSETMRASDGRSFQVTCSVGIAEWCVEDEAGELIMRADQALYAAKQSGRNCTMRG